MKARSILCPFLLAVSALLAGSVQADAPRTREFDLTYSARIADLPPGAHKVDLWLPYPVSDEHQEVKVTEVSSPYPHEVLREPRLGNSILHVAVTDPQARDLTVEMKVHVRRKEYLHNDFASYKPGAKGARPADVAQWLKPDRLVPIDDRVRKLSGEITAGKQTDLEKAGAIYDYAEVDGKPYPNVAKSFRFQDQDGRVAAR